MKDQFITETFSIDLSASDTSFTEENPRFKDSIWTKLVCIMIEISSQMWGNILLSPMKIFLNM